MKSGEDQKISIVYLGFKVNWIHSKNYYIIWYTNTPNIIVIFT